MVGYCRFSTAQRSKGTYRGKGRHALKFVTFDPIWPFSIRLGPTRLVREKGSGCNGLSRGKSGKRPCSLLSWAQMRELGAVGPAEAYTPPPPPPLCPANTKTPNQYGRNA